MWPYTPDEQIWLAPSKEWAASVMAAEVAKRTSPAWRPSELPTPQLPVPLPMPAPYGEGISDPQIILRK